MRRSQSIRRYAPWFSLLLLLLAGCAMTGSNVAQLDDFMAQERAWAGLATRRAMLADGRAIVYSEGGPTGAPTLVLLHGYTGDRNHWNRVARELSSRFHLVIPDLPGHGETALARDASPDAMSNTMIDFARSIGLAHYTLVGHSMGGAVATLWALGQPSHVDALVLIDTAGIYADNPSPVMQQIRAGDNPLRIDTRADYQRLPGVAMARPPFIPQSIEDGLAQRAVAHRADQSRILDRLLTVQNHIPAESFQMTLASLAMPALIIWGDQDRIFDVRVVDELTAGLPDAQVVVLDGIGHTPIREAPLDTARAITTFLDSVIGQESG